MFDIYQSRRKPQYELAVPHGTDIKAYDRWNGEWQRRHSPANHDDRQLAAAVYLLTGWPTGVRLSPNSGAIADMPVGPAWAV